MKKKQLFMMAVLLSVAQLICADRLHSIPISYSNATVYYKAEMEIINNKPVATFDVTVPSAGYYYSSFWIQGVKHADDTYSTYKVWLDNSPTYYMTLTQNSADWGFTNLVSVYMPSGTHKVRVSSDSLDDVPNVDFLYCSSSSGVPSSNPYLQMKSHTQPVSSVIGGDYQTVFHYDEIGTSSYPPTSFIAERDKSIYYTFLRLEYFTEGDSVKISVTDMDLNTDGWENVISVFFYDQNYPGFSWTSTDFLAEEITRTGFYYVMVRTDSNDTWGTCSFSINGERFFENVPVSCCKTEIPSTMEDGNYWSFALGTNCDLMSLALAPAGGVYHYDDDRGYNATNSDFDWGTNPCAWRYMYGGFSHLVTLANSYPQGGNVAVADVYTGVPSISMYLYLNPADYPNYKESDQMVSAPATPYNDLSSYHYNDLSWAFGSWTHQEFLSHDSLLSQLEELDEYAEISGYIRVASPLTLWEAVDVYVNDGSISHAAVKSKSHYFSAGYAWESKLGDHERVFHPRHSLEGGDAGTITYYYRKSPYLSNSLQPCDLRVLENVSFTDEEQEAIDRGVAQVSDDVAEAFEGLLRLCYEDAVRKPFASLSQFAKLRHYGELLSLCRKNPETLYLICRHLPTDFGLTYRLIYDFGGEKYEGLKKQITGPDKEKRTDESGRRVLRTSRSKALLFAKALLNDGAMQKTIGGITYSSDPKLSLSQSGMKATVSFELESPASVTLVCECPQRGPVRRLMENERLSPGRHCADVELQGTGIYVFSLIVDGCVYEKKVIVK